MSSSIQVCKDLSEAIELCEPRGLYLKPLARCNISVQLPVLKNPGISISNWEVMEKLKKLARPCEFMSLKVSKTSMEFIRFEGEVENRNVLKQIISRTDASTIKLGGFPDPLKVKSAEAKLNFPSRHDWDSFFRDAKNMNEMKPGERPDTVFFSNLPIKWFSDDHSLDNDKPSSRIVKEVFQSLGDVRCLDVPMLDRHQKDINKPVGAIQTFSFSQDLSFEAYVQFKEYVSFVKAMDTLRGMKLLHKSADGKIHIASIKVDFDKTKHLSAKNIRRRILDKQKLVNLEKQKEDRVLGERAEEEKQKEQEIQRKREEEFREDEKRRKKEAHSKEKEKRHQRKLQERRKAERAAIRQRKRMILRRRKEAKALLKEILENARQQDITDKMEAIEQERLKQIELEEKKKQAEVTRKDDLERVRQENLKKQEEKLREKLLFNLKVREEKRTDELRERLREELAGRNILKSVLVASVKPKLAKKEQTYLSQNPRTLKSFYQLPHKQLLPESEEFEDYPPKKQPCKNTSSNFNRNRGQFFKSYFVDKKSGDRQKDRFYDK